MAVTNLSRREPFPVNFMPINAMLYCHEALQNNLESGFHHKQLHEFMMIKLNLFLSNIKHLRYLWSRCGMPRNGLAASILDLGWFYRIYKLIIIIPSYTIVFAGLITLTRAVNKILSTIVVIS
jgi:hypothetical protein